jgi:hypothetical protein
MRYYWLLLADEFRVKVPAYCEGGNPNDFHD